MVTSAGSCLALPERRVGLEIIHQKTGCVERGVAVLQCYAIAETGVIAYESDAKEGMIVNETLIVEIVRPGTGDPVAEGEVGEVVVTSFNPDYPMIRLGTGDLSAFMTGASPCGNIRHSFVSYHLLNTDAVSSR